MSDISTNPKDAALGIDFDPGGAARQDIVAERDKRIRDDGNEQYVEVKGDFTRYVDDPYVEPGFTRAPLDEAVEVLIIGGGFGGLLAGARLREAGFDDIRIDREGRRLRRHLVLEPLSRRAVRHRGYIYLPLLEETGYIPKEKYSFAPEILEHSQRIARNFDLYRGALFQTEIRELAWNEDECRWIVTTNRDDRLSARYVIMSNGPLNRPKLPGIPGIDSFKGHTFHTSRWDYDYTGGDTTGNLHKLADKRVAIIGTGATAIQCVPHLGKAAKHLYVFQRTPSSVDERRNRPTDPEWAKSLNAGWQRARMENFNTLVTGGQDEVTWSATAGPTSFAISARWCRARAPLRTRSRHDMARMMELADFKKMNQVRARVDCDREGSEDRRGAEAMVSAVLQAPDLQRRISADLQPPQRDAGRHAREGRRAHHREGAGVRRGRVRSRLHHLRDRLRGRHRLHAARRIRDLRARRAVADRLLVRRDENPARLFQPRLPELLSYGAAAKRDHRELPACAR